MGLFDFILLGMAVKIMVDILRQIRNSRGHRQFSYIIECIFCNGIRQRFNRLHLHLRSFRQWNLTVENHYAILDLSS
jgi:hypothetical protein